MNILNIRENAFGYTAACAHCDRDIEVTAPAWLFNADGEPVCVSCGNIAAPNLVQALNIIYTYGVLDGDALVDAGSIDTDSMLPSLN